MSIACVIAVCMACVLPETPIYYYVVNQSKERISMHWQDSVGNSINSLASLSEIIEQNRQIMVFAMNGGMYKPDTSPVGLYIENGKVLHPINSDSGAGNFYMHPNGVFYLDKKEKAFICTTADFILNDDVEFATQSGPILLLDSRINPIFNTTSVNKQVRNGVGIDSKGNVFMAISKEKITFHDFASFFKDKGCTHALYLDGFVSRYFVQGNDNNQHNAEAFAVMIAVSKK
ncbi:MAG: phosphodiester glycosidase family protein [Bacteroidetes bacterium]|nr:phosphodiester glycosidase family protein [Bacteroidota bacterium]